MAKSKKQALSNPDGLIFVLSRRGLAYCVSIWLENAGRKPDIRDIERIVNRLHKKGHISDILWDALDEYLDKEVEGLYRSRARGRRSTVK